MVEVVEFAERKRSEKKKPSLIVIGDWLFDEDWVTGRHRGAVRSRAGSEHLRALHHHGNAVFRIAGAGQTASIIYRVLKEHYTICGAGIWDKKDENAIRALVELDMQMRAQHSEYRIVRDFAGGSGDLTLINLAKIIESTIKDEGRYQCGTMRVIRIYQHHDDKLELKQRIDWEPRIFHDQSSWVGISKEAVLNNGDLDKSEDLEAVYGAKLVVLQDLNKGVISSPVVKWLIKVAPEAAWYVSTKAWRPAREPLGRGQEPDWLGELHRAGADVRLLVIPRASAQRTVDDGDLSRWIVPDKGVPSSEALKRTGELARQFPNAAVVVLPGGFTVLARDNRSMTCRRQINSVITPTSDDVGAPMATVFFSALVARLATRLATEATPDMEEDLKQALSVTARSWEYEVDRLKHSEEEPRRPVTDFAALGNLGQKARKGFGDWLNDDWNTMTSEWEQALRECGIIEPDVQLPHQSRRIELWRAMIDIGGYVCCVPTKRYAIGRIRRQIEFFKKEPRVHPHGVSVLVVAPPGSGKTHFVKQLAKSCSLSLVSFNITQLNSKDDILGCFDTIVTRQTQDDRPLLVFFDEINARINGQQVYDCFLAPIEDGIYFRSGKTYQMPACAWLFAGTENPADNQDKSSKGLDFVSRLTIPPIDVKLGAGEEADLNTEHVYIGASLLKLAFSDVREVSEKVLRAFEFMRPDVDVRQIRHFVNSFSDVQHEKVLSRNLPMDELKNLTHAHSSHRHSFDTWKELEEGNLVLIESESPRKRPSLREQPSKGPGGKKPQAA
jgi:hypothetical protein